MRSALAFPVSGLILRAVILRLSFEIRAFDKF